MEGIMENKKNAVFVATMLAALTVGASASAQTAMQSDSWNLSRIMMSNDLNGALNPTVAVAPETGVWSFMENPSGTLFPPTNSGFVLLPAYTQGCLDVGAIVTPLLSFNCFQPFANPGALPLIGVSPFTPVTFNNGFSLLTLIQGMPLLHPGPVSQAIVSWTAPQNMKVRILGRVADVDAKCGDGIQWGIQKDVNAAVGSPLTTVAPYLTYSAVMNGASTFTVPSVPVLAGAKLYFIIDKGAPNAAGTNSDHYCDSTTLDVLISRLP
jgi:hypothetical protein